MAVVRKQIYPNTLGGTAGVEIRGYNYVDGTVNKRWRHNVYSFKDTGINDELYGVFTVPQDYSANAAVQLKWTVDASAGNAVWAITYSSVEEGESLDAIPMGSGLQITTAPSSAHNLAETAISLNATDFNSGDLVEFSVMRVGKSSTDSIVGDYYLHSVEFLYTNT